MSTPAKTIRSKACAVCGEPFSFTRSDAKTCGRDACRKTLSRRHGKLPRLPWDEELHPFRPTSLHSAVFALEHGCHPAELILHEDERTLITAASSRFTEQERFDAATRLLAGRLAWVGTSPLSTMVNLGLDETDRHLLVLEAIRAAWNETYFCGVWRPGPGNTIRRATGRSRVAPYVPAKGQMRVLLFDFLPREIERRVRGLREAVKDDFHNASALHLDGPSGVADEDDDVLALEEVIGAEDSALGGGEEALWQPARGSEGKPYQPFATSKDALRRASLEARKDQQPLSEFDRNGIVYDLRQRRSLHITRPAYPEPFYGDEGALDPRTEAYWTARAKHYRQGRRQAPLGKSTYHGGSQPSSVGFDSHERASADETSYDETADFESKVIA